ncbi:MAG: aspartyl protease family protein [Candidatus Eisenbacteria bacterium]
MLKRLYPLVAVALAVALSVPSVAQTEVSDPYEILTRHYEAVGGLERLKAEGPYSVEGTLSVAGLTGTLTRVSGGPGLHRTEVDLGIFKQTTGDNGDLAWELDANGKVSIVRDEVGLRTRDLERRIDEYEHLERDSEIFVVTYDGTEAVEGSECHVVRVANTLDESYRLMYVDAESFMLRKTVDARDNHEMHTLHYDYRDAAGIIYPSRDVSTILPIGQTQTVEILAFEPEPSFDPSVFDPPSDEADDYSFVSGESSVDVPFQFIERHLFLPVTMGGVERLWVLDTGASSSVIDSEFAAELGLESKGQTQGMGAGSAVDVSFVVLPPFSLPGIEFAEQNAASIAISSLFERTSDLEIGGILGYDFLSRFVTRVDYANELLTFYAPAAFSYEGDGVTLDAPLSGNIFGVEAAVDGEHEGRWTLDLGAGGVSFHYPYAESHGFLERRGIEVVGFGAGGKIENRLLKFESIELAGFVVESPYVSCPTGQLDGAFGSSDRIGNLGNTLFRHFVLYLDYENQQVVVEKGGDFGRDFPVDRSGLQMWRTDDGGLEVFHVAPGTPAEESGIAAGDVVTSIDGEDSGSLDLISIRKMLRGDAGTEHTFGIERDGRASSATLVLRDLL